MAASVRLAVDVVVLAGWIQFARLSRARDVRRLLPVLRVEVHRVVRKRRYEHVVDIGVEGAHPLRALIRHRESSRLAERHREVAIQRFARRTSQICGLVMNVLTEIESEEITYRSFDARLRIAVPVCAKDN